MQHLPSVLVLTGETASGKSEIAVLLAEAFGAEILGADSRQIYRGMPIGTAAPTPEQCARVPHHLIAHVDPFERYSAARYVAEALQAVNAIHARGKRVLIVGGTGFYIRALCGDVDLGPEVDMRARERMHRETNVHDAAFLYEWLRLRNPKRAAELQPGDAYRITRALETSLAAPVEQHRIAHAHLRSCGFPYIKVWIRSNRDVLEQRIEQRVDRMLADGFIEEAERIGATAVAADAVGYPHALAYLAGRMTHAELRTLMMRSTRRYAKRQATWLRSEPNLIEVEPAADRFTVISQFASRLLQWLPVT